MSDLPIPKNFASLEKWADALVRFLSDSGIDTQAQLSFSPPIGTQVKYPHATIFPKGWLKCDGASYATSRYPKLAQVLGAGGATLTVPTAAGEMIRAD